jgi:short-chain dehydrogenase, putative
MNLEKVNYLDLFQEVINLILNFIYVYLKTTYYLVVGYPKKEVKDNVIVITGAGHGLGKEMSKIFAAHQAKIALIDVNKDNCKNVEKEIKAAGGVVKGYQCDVTDEERITKVINQIEQDLGPIDILINNAGITYCRAFNNVQPECVRKVFEVNTFAHFWTIQAVLKSMIERQKGQIVAISSIAGLVGTANLVDYCASKFAVIGLMEALDQELHEGGKNQDIHLTTICPLAMSTGMFHSPKTRFPKLFPICTSTEAAAIAVEAILTEQYLVTLPKYAKLFHQIGR